MSDLGLDVVDLTKSYPVPGGELVVLAHASFKVKGGEAVAIVGPSGCGKSTLLHLLGGLDAPTSGRIAVNGVDVGSLRNRELAAFRNRTVGFVFQDHHLLPQCTVLENVLIPTLAAGGATLAATARAKSLLERVGLAPRIDHRPAELSGGERQRAAIARALIQNPALLLCDEPTGNLDPASAGSIGDLLVDLGKEPDRMLVLVTHSMELAGRLPRRLAFRDGRLAE